MTKLEKLMVRLEELAKNTAFSERSGINYDKEGTKEELENIIGKIYEELDKDAE